MKRRTFLALAAILTLWIGAGTLTPRLNATAAPVDRKTAWGPNPNPILASEWRYVAGRIADSAADYGFVVSLSDTRFPQQTYDLLVERQDFTGAKSFVANSYTGTRGYNSTTGVYTFQASQGQVSATWQWDETNQVYRLALTSPELNLPNVVLRPQGALIPEGGDGAIGAGEAMGVQLDSDYYADWTRIEIGGAAKGFARLDMQGLYPAIAAVAALDPQHRRATRARPASPAQADDYDHHWFAIAGQSDGQPVWISAWRIETQTGPLWDVTIARGGGGSYSSVSSKTEADPAVAPLAVQPTDGQPLPAPNGPAQGTGMAWHITAGTGAPGDLIDLRVTVPPRQFATSARLGEGLSWIEEGVGSTTASGTVLGRPLNNVSLVVAETTFEFGLKLQYVPLVRR